VAPYIIAQLLGSVLGGVAARLVWGPVVARAPVAYAALQPGPGWSTLSLFAAETVSMGIIVLLIGFCLAVARLTPFVPWIVGGAIGIAIAALGTSTGGSVNPARQFGPATLSGQTHFLWAYLLAPMAGANSRENTEPPHRKRDGWIHMASGRLAWWTHDQAGY
jgi:glycerol uptake facilitator-like aquaporin